MSNQDCALLGKAMQGTTGRGPAGHCDAWGLAARSTPAPVTPANTTEPEPCAACGGLGRHVGTAFLGDEFGSEVPAEEPCEACDSTGWAYPHPMPALRNVAPIQLDDSPLPF